MKIEFPKWLYHPTKAAKIVHSAEEMAAHGVEWAEAPFIKAEHAIESAVASVENTLADAADTVAKKLRKPRKPAEQQ